MIDVRCPLCKNRYSCEQIGMIPFENCGMFVIDDTIKRHKTNADRIRSMTDEELAEWLERIRLCCSTDSCGRSCPFAQVCYSNAEEPKEMLDWLREEVKDV